MEEQAIPQAKDGRKDSNSTTHKRQKQTPVESLTRQELETRVRQLEAHNKQLQNLLAKSQGITGISTKADSNTQAKKARAFDFTRHSKRHVLLKFAYLGWDYHGFAVQEDTQQTIEAQLFSAFLKTRLIESRETSNYHRCGRTDKGVSAFDQVISITLRSKMNSGVGVIKPEDAVMSSAEEVNGPEINYVQLLNRVLPIEIRMLAWCPVPSGYSARFDCSFRMYKYFFPRGSLNIKLMNEGAQYLVGYHDYRNFCKMDVGNGVVNFCRRILSVDIAPVCCDVQKDKESLSRRVENQIEEVKSKEHEMDSDINSVITNSNSCKHYIHKPTNVRQTFSSSCLQHKAGIKFSHHKKLGNDGYDMCVATIEGQAFLWHQVRAVMAILLLVGEGKEKPEIVAELLDVEKNPRKPQYCLASDVPLNLYETTFEGVKWQWDNEHLQCVISQLQGLWTKYSVRTTMIRRMLWDLETQNVEVMKSKEEYESNEEKSSSTQEESEVTKFPQEQSASLIPGARTKVYRPLLSRPTCESLETRVEHYIKRQRIDPVILEKLSSVDSDRQQKQLS